MLRKFPASETSGNSHYIISLLDGITEKALHVNVRSTLSEITSETNASREQTHMLCVINSMKKSVVSIF